MTNIVKLNKVWQGRMGTNLSIAWEVYVDGELVGFAKAKWLAQAIGDAVANGHISGTGDTEMAFSNWAYKNAPDLFDRMSERAYH